jgi:hypothetical protein
MAVCMTWVQEALRSSTSTTDLCDVCPVEIKVGSSAVDLQYTIPLLYLLYY